MKQKKRIKVLGMGNRDKFNYIIVKKDRNFFNWLSKIFHASFEKMPDVEKEEYVDEKSMFVSKKKNINKYVDIDESYPAGDSYINIFYGKDKIFITVLTSLKNRKKLMDNLEKYSEFVEYKKGEKK